MTGLSNLKDIDETPYDYAAKEVLPFNVNGLDTEGLVRTDAGDFWIADEYGPSLVHVDRSGKVVKRYIPEGVKLDGADYPIAPVLPAIYAKRKINRGFEGLALSADEKTLYLLLQSPLLNPDKNIGDASRNTRVLLFDIGSEKVTAEYAYRFEASKDFDPGPKNTPDEMKLSGVVALSPTTLLILERTDVVAKLYTVDLSRATNLLGGKWDDAEDRACPRSAGRSSERRGARLGEIAGCRSEQLSMASRKKSKASLYSINAQLRSPTTTISTVKKVNMTMPATMSAKAKRVRF